MTVWICLVIAIAIILASLASAIDEIDDIDDYEELDELTEETQMLVLSRKEDEWVTVFLPDGRTMQVGVVAMRQHNVRLGFKAPLDVRFERDNAQNKTSSEAGAPLGERVQSLRPESGDCEGH